MRNVETFAQASASLWRGPNAMSDFQHLCCRADSDSRATKRQIWRRRDAYLVCRWLNRHSRRAGNGADRTTPGDKCPCRASFAAT